MSALHSYEVLVAGHWQWFVQRTVGDVAILWVNLQDPSQTISASARHGMPDKSRYVNLVEVFRRQLVEEERVVTPERFAAFEAVFMEACGDGADGARR